MKKTRIIANIIIVLMLSTLSFFAFNNASALKVQADSRVIYAGDENKNNVCFMINVYQREDLVENILDILDHFEVKTTFFVGGSWAVKNLDLVKSIYSRGHEIGNHGFYHKEQNKLTYEENLQEIKACHDVIEKNVGLKMTLFAPPSGSYDKTTIDVAESLNYKTIMWTHDTIDWRDQNCDLIFNRATKDLSNGDLILMHPTPKTVEILPTIISTAINSGFVPSTVTSCL